MFLVVGVFFPFYYYYFFSQLIYLFPTTGSSEASGNAGLLDQLAALKWVQQNIGSFGGDPSQVTVGADRGGADIASIHLLTEAINMGLFRRVLLMVSHIPAVSDSF